MAVQCMDETLISERLMAFFEQQGGLNFQTRRNLAAGSINVVGDFFFEFSMPSTWHLCDIKRTAQGEIIFYWKSYSQQADCPLCATTSHRQTKTYETRTIQDLPMFGMTVYHKITNSHFFCENDHCSILSFIEQHEYIAEKNAQLSNRLKEFCVRLALESSCNGTSKALAGIGAKVSGDTIEREVKKKGALVVTGNLQREDVNVLAIDDINLRKGNSSTACTVFIDGETHRVLVIAQGATTKVAEKIIKQYPEAKIVSRDRDTAYAAAAQRCGKTQVADGFHLIQNIHKTVKDVIGQEMAQDLFVREGKGWISIVDSACEPNEAKDQDDGRGLLFIGPAKMKSSDLEKRICLAGLTDRQADKYKKTMAILKLTESGLRTADIAKKLKMKKYAVHYYRKQAPETIEAAEQKIDKLYRNYQAVTGNKNGPDYRQETIADKARPSSESIVAPYKDIVLNLFAEGKTHRDIHPVLVQKGFKGSANAIYQYIIKYMHENGLPYERKPGKQRQNSERDILAEHPRPSRISVERVSRTTLYENILHLAAKQRDEIKQAMQGLQANKKAGSSQEKTNEAWVNKTNYTDSVAKLVLDIEKKKKSAKKN